MRKVSDVASGPDLFAALVQLPTIVAISRTSYDTGSEGPMPPFFLEVASESTWRYDVGEKALLYLVFDPAR